MGYFILFIIIIIMVAVVMTGNKQAKRQAELKARYHEALKGADKAYALSVGRQYYASLRKDGKLSMYDEQALTNDLTTMQY